MTGDERLRGGPGRRIRTLTWCALRPLAAVLARYVFRMQVRGREHLPTQGGYLLLANHTTNFDAVFLASSTSRPVRFMASADLFRRTLPRWILGALGAYPKEKFVRDDASLAATEAMVKGGEIVQIHPEGARTWDGHLLPIRAGTGALVKRLAAPVVCARITTGHLFWPRWATYPRWLPVRVEFDPPRKWGDNVDASTILEEIRSALSIDPEPDLSGAWRFGCRMAEGLPQLLWSCPQCFSRSALAAAGSSLSCNRCDGQWAVAADGRLNSEAGDTVTITEAYRRIREHFGDPPVDPSAAGGAVLEAERGRWFRLDAPGVLGPAPVRLFPDRLVIADEEIPLRAIAMLTTSLGNVLLIRMVDGRRFRLEAEPTLLWEHFLRPYHEAARQRLAASAVQE